MLYITTSHTNGDSAWHVGQHFPIVSIEAVQEVQADGDELAYIYNHVRRWELPPNRTTRVRWFGDEAKFIAANLR